MSADIHTEVQESPEPVESELAPLETPDETPEPKADEDHVDGSVEIKPGETYVPKGAVIAERKKRQELEQERDALREKAAQADQLATWVHESKPYIDFLRQNPDFLKARDPKSAPPSPQTDTDAIEYAKEFDLYAADGTPDTARARRIIDKQTAIAQQAAQAAVKPFAQQTMEQRAAGNLERIKAQKDGSGNPVGDEALNATAGLLIAQMGRDNAVALFADPGNASVIAAIAHGLQVMTPKKAPITAPEGAPLETEQSGGGSDLKVSEHSLRVTGLTEAKYRDAAKRFTPGQTNPLE